MDFVGFEVNMACYTKGARAHSWGPKKWQAARDVQQGSPALGVTHWQIQRWRWIKLSATERLCLSDGKLSHWTVSLSIAKTLGLVLGITLLKRNKLLAMDTCWGISLAQSPATPLLSPILHQRSLQRSYFLVASSQIFLSTSTPLSSPLCHRI